MRELRCSNPDCKKKKGKNSTKAKRKPQLLGKSMMMPGSILEIKCPYCGTVTQFKSEKAEENVENVITH